MKNIKVVTFLALMLGSSSVFSMDPDLVQSEIGQESKALFQIFPTLKHSVQIFLIKQFLQYPDFKERFSQAILPEDMSKITLVADFFMCLLELSHLEQLSNDSNLLAQIYSSEMTKQISRELEVLQSMQDKSLASQIARVTQKQELVTCITTSLNQIVESSSLLELTLLLLNDPVIHDTFAKQRPQAFVTLTGIIDILFVRSNVNQLYNFFMAYPAARSYYLKLLTTLYTQEFYEIHKIIKDFAPNIFNSNDTSDSKQQKVADLKTAFLEDLVSFYELIPHSRDDEQDPEEVAVILKKLLTPEVLQDRMPLLDVLFAKGYTPNVEFGRDTLSIVMFDTYFDDLFGTQEKKQATVGLLTYLIKNGLDISLLEEVDQSDDEALIQAQQNFKQFKKENPELVKGLLLEHIKYEQRLVKDKMLLSN